jgi:sec-independent protein translocase protein TatC
MEVEKTLGEHLDEVRSRLVRCAAAWLTAALLGFWFREPLFKTLTEPVGTLVFLGPADALMAYVKLSLLFGLVLSAPYHAWHLWGFFAPALEAPGRRTLAWGLALGLFLFLTGVGLAWMVAVNGLKVLLDFAGPNMRPMVTVDAYFSFLFTLAVGCGLAFELPLFSWLLARFGLLQYADLAYHWREAVLASLVLSALITPSGDAVTQLLLAGPLLGLYVLSLWVVAGVEKNRTLRASLAHAVGDANAD